MGIDNFLDALKQIKPFPAEQFVDRLYNKARETEPANVFRADLAAKDAYGRYPDNLELDQVDVSAQLKLLAEHALVKGLAHVDAEVDKNGMRNCCNTDNAEIVGNALFSQTSTLLFSEHVNWSLESLGSQNLRALMQDGQFVKDLETRLKSSHFIAGALRQDLANRDHTYTTCLLWAYDYVHLGPGFMPHLDEAFATAPSGLLLTHWASELFNLSLDSATSTTITLNLSKAASLVHALTNQLSNVQPASALQHFEALTAQGVFNSNHGSNLDELTRANGGTWQSICGQIAAFWKNTESLWSHALATVVAESSTHTVETSSDAEQFGEGMLLGLTLGGVWHQNWQTTTTSGRRVADWINQGNRDYSSLFYMKAPDVVETYTFSTNGSPPKSCFVAGTLVATEAGAVRIEDLREGHHILTRADPVTYGIRSDEDVVVPLESDLLCGINDEKPFFTAGHVFHTTSGLRAVNPSIAKSENPWLEVNQLAPGHLLYRYREGGEGYEHVEIKTITREKVEKVHVYGVHLREGHRSYHANGYLVAVNYPEITVKSIAKMLATFPKHTQIQLLHHIGELRALFARFGAETISEALSRELHGTMPNSPASGVGGIKGKRRLLTSKLRNARRTFVLHNDGSNEIEDYRLPLLSIHEGNVLLDGVAQHRAIIEKDDKTVRWTRAVAGHGYEHGHLNVCNHGFSGSGVVLLSHDPNLAAMDSSQHSSRMIRFYAAKPNARIETPSTVPDHVRHLRVTRFLHNQHARTALGHMPTDANVAFLDGNSHIESVEADTVTIPGLEATTQHPSVEVLGDFIDGDDLWDLTMDTAIWQPKTPAPVMSSPARLGQVSFCTYHAGGAAGLPVPILTMPLLDQLCADINAAHLSSLQGKPELTSLYSSHLEITKNGLQMGTIELDEAALIYKLADKPDGSQDLASVMNVTFKKSLPKSNVKLPLLFRTLALELSASFDAIKGVALEYDSDRRGANGFRHLVTDSDSVPNAIRPIALASRLAISKTLAAVRPQPVGMLATMAAAPAPVTFALAASTAMSTGELAGMTGYNSVSVHDSSQTLLQNTMEFHMHADDRTKFLQTAAPEVGPSKFPIELANKLNDDLQKWIRNVYGPAFVSFMISQIKPTDENRKWRGGLTEADKDRVWYWWQGAGDKCLSRSPEYNKLNGLVSVYAVRQLYDATLGRYIADGGEKWAKLMLNSLINNKHALKACMRVPTGGGELALNKYCNTLNALDPTGKHADEFFNAVVAFAIAENVKNPPFPLDEKAAEKQKTWLKDAMHELIIKVLNKDPTLRSTVSEELRNDLNEFLKAWNLQDLKDAEAVAGEVLAKTSELIGNIVMYMQYIGDGFKALARLSGFKSAAAVTNHALSKLPGAKKGGFPWLKGIFTILLVAGYVFSAYNEFTNWDKLTGPQRAIAIISTLATVVDVVDKCYTVFKAGKEWRELKYPKDILPSQEAAGAALLDAKLEEKLNSPEGARELNQANMQAKNQSLRKSYESNFNIENQPHSSPNVTQNGIEEVGPEELIAVQRRSEPPADLPPSGRTPWKTFTKAERALKCAAVIVGIAFTIAMSLDLKDNWDSYTDVGKALNVLQIAVQGLTVLVDAAILIGDALVASSWIAAESTVMVVLPVLGAILALIGIAVMVVLMFVKTRKDEPPPLDPVEKFLITVAHPLIKDMSDPPTAELSYSLPFQIKASQDATVQLTATNNTDKDVSLTRTSITVDVGSDPEALFSAPTSDWKLWKKEAGGTQPTGTASSDHTDLYTGSLIPQRRGNASVSYDFGVAGPLANGVSSKLIVKAKQSMAISWLGKVNQMGASIIYIVETRENGDKCRVRLPVVRMP